MYYCRYCGKPYSTDAAVVCVECGAPKGKGSNYCWNCGQPTDPNGVVCTHCGVSLAPVTDANSKSKVAAGLLGLFLGGFGAHNFYLGYTSKAVVQLVLTLVGIALSCIVVGFFLVAGVGIWAFVEAIMIFTGSISTDAKGNPLRD